MACRIRIVTADIECGPSKARTISPAWPKLSGGVIRACFSKRAKEIRMLRSFHKRIRDEAHRFANAYHQLLLKKRIDESILDDCPGVSQNRKSLLLRKFGSVNRLRKASVEQIAATEGIGPKLAEEVHRFLQRH